MTHCSRLTQVGQACLRNRKRAQKSEEVNDIKSLLRLSYIIILIRNFILNCILSQCHVHLIVNFQKENCKVSMYKFLLQKKKA